MIMECDLRSLKKVRSHSSKGEDGWDKANKAVFDWHLIASSPSKYLP